MKLFELLNAEGDVQDGNSYQRPFGWPEVPVAHSKAANHNVVQFPGTQSAACQSQGRAQDPRADLVELFNQLGYNPFSGPPVPMP